MIGWLIFAFVAVVIVVYGWELLKRFDLWLGSR